MTRTPATDAPARTPGMPSARAMKIMLIVVSVVVAGMVALIVWAIGTSGGTSGSQPTFDRFEPGWESAMSKAGVVATFPAGPVDLTQVRTSGSRPFSATFTAEEMSALMSVYRFETTERGFTVSAGDVDVAFPEDGVADLNAVLYAQGSRYRARATAPFVYDGTQIASPGFTSLRFAGFAVTGSRRDDAAEGFLMYLNRYLDAAPGLSIESARIVTGGVEVEGIAPESIEHPEPLGR